MSTYLNVPAVPTSHTSLNSLTTSDTSARRWYALYTCARHEKWVAHQLQERCFESFLPLYRSVHQWKDRRKVVELALFPSYVFVRISSWERIRVLQVPGVVQLVSFNGIPAALPETEIQALRNGFDQKLCAEPHPYLTAGRRVRVMRGPLLGAEGILIYHKGKSRVVITLDVLMRSVAVETDTADLEPLPTPGITRFDS